jgi:hypothetical protein
MSTDYSQSRNSGVLGDHWHGKIRRTGYWCTATDYRTGSSSVLNSRCNARATAVFITWFHKKIHSVVILRFNTNFANTDPHFGCASVYKTESCRYRLQCQDLTAPLEMYE